MVESTKRYQRGTPDLLHLPQGLNVLCISSFRTRTSIGFPTMVPITEVSSTGMRIYAGRSDQMPPEPKMLQKMEVTALYDSQSQEFLEDHVRRILTGYIHIFLFPHRQYTWDCYLTLNSDGSINEDLSTIDANNLLKEGKKKVVATLQKGIITSVTGQVNVPEETAGFHLQKIS